MDPHIESWMEDLTTRLSPELVDVEHTTLVAYIWNSRKGHLHFIGQKTADKLRRKGIYCARLLEEWPCPGKKRFRL